MGTKSFTFSAIVSLSAVHVLLCEFSIHSTLSTQNKLFGNEQRCQGLEIAVQRVIQLIISNREIWQGIQRKLLF